MCSYVEKLLNKKFLTWKNTNPSLQLTRNCWPPKEWFGPLLRQDPPEFPAPPLTGWFAGRDWGLPLPLGASPPKRFLKPPRNPWGSAVDKLTKDKKRKGRMLVRKFILIPMKTPDSQIDLLRSLSLSALFTALIRTDQGWEMLEKQHQCYYGHSTVKPGLICHEYASSSLYIKSTDVRTMGHIQPCKPNNRIW